jgi:hypothetical protein
MMQCVAEDLNQKLYDINPIYIDITGSITAGYLLTQLIFLSRSFGYREFCQTDAELQRDYRLGRRELADNRKKLISLGVISVVRKGVPAKLHYRINIEKIIELAIALENINQTRELGLRGI